MHSKEEFIHSFDVRIFWYVITICIDKKKVFDKQNSYPENGFPSAVLNAFIKQMNIYLNKRQAFGSAVRWLSTT